MINGHDCFEFPPGTQWLILAKERDGALELIDDCYGAFEVAPRLGATHSDPITQLEADFAAGLTSPEPKHRILSLQRPANLQSERSPPVPRELIATGPRKVMMRESISRPVTRPDSVAWRPTLVFALLLAQFGLLGLTVGGQGVLWADLLPMLGHVGLEATDEHPHRFVIEGHECFVYDIGVLEPISSADLMAAQAEPPLPPPSPPLRVTLVCLGLALRHCRLVPPKESGIGEGPSVRGLPG